MCRLVLIAALLLAGCSRPVDDTSIPSLQLDSGPSDLGRDGALPESDVGTGSPEDMSVAEVGVDAGSGTPVGQVWNTYYYLAPESEHPGDKTVELLNDACDPIATVSSDYHLAVCIEGSGLLDDGRVINYSSRCDCGTPCSSGTSSP